MIKYIDWIQKTTMMFKKAGIDSPKLSAELILSHVLNITRLQIIMTPFEPIPTNSYSTLNDIMLRRLHGEPIAYLTGKKEFFSREFKVTQATLIPRPETELLIEFVLNHINPTQQIYFADLGTGSGCIAITLAAERKNWLGIATDISSEALKIAKLNSLKNNTHSQLQFLQSDFTQPLCLPSSLDLYISNPPYINENELTSLPHEVISFEPKIALTPHKCIHLDEINTVLHCYKKIITQAEISLKPGGIIILEHGATQAEAILLLLKNNIWTNVISHTDLTNKNRFITAYKYKI